MDAELGAGRQAFPPDRRFDLPRGLTVTRAFVLAVAVGAIVDVVVFGLPETPIPSNYPFYGDILLLLFAGWACRRIHTLLDGVKIELVDLVRLSHEQPLSPPFGAPPAPETVEAEIETILERGFRPAALAAGALLGGALSLGTMAVLGVLWAYPYWVMNFGFGAAHGLFIGPALASIALVYKTSTSYIVTIDVLDPDGVGGYRKIGNTLVTITVYGIAIATLDVLILSSVALLGTPTFHVVVGVLYGLVLASLVLGTLVSAWMIRRRLLSIRDHKVEDMRRRLRDVESRFWSKQAEGQPTQGEALNIVTMNSIFQQLYSMDMWPLNWWSFLKLAASVTVSLTVFLGEAAGLLTRIL